MQPLRDAGRPGSLPTRVADGLGRRSGASLRDGTVAWVMAIHVAMLMVMSFFTWA